MRSILVIIAALGLIPSVVAGGHTDDVQGNPEGPIAGVDASRYGCNDLAADIRSLDVTTADGMLTLSLTVWDGASRPACHGVSLPRSQLDHSMLVRGGEDHTPFEVRFDLVEDGEGTIMSACGHLFHLAFEQTSNGTWRRNDIQTGCLEGTTRSGSKTTFAIPTHGIVDTPTGPRAYDLRGSHGGWTLGYTHSFVADQLFVQDWVTTSSDI